MVGAKGLETKTLTWVWQGQLNCNGSLGLLLVGSVLYEKITSCISLPVVFLYPHRDEPGPSAERLLSAVNPRELSVVLSSKWGTLASSVVIVPFSKYPVAFP